jgi:hypothetical protein
VSLMHCHEVAKRIGRMMEEPRIINRSVREEKGCLEFVCVRRVHRGRCHCQTQGLNVGI